MNVGVSLHYKMSCQKPTLALTSSLSWHQPLPFLGTNPFPFLVSTSTIPRHQLFPFPCTSLFPSLAPTLSLSWCQRSLYSQAPTLSLPFPGINPYPPLHPLLPFPGTHRFPSLAPAPSHPWHLPFPSLAPILSLPWHQPSFCTTSGGEGEGRNHIQPVV